MALKEKQLHNVMNGKERFAWCSCVPSALKTNMKKVIKRNPSHTTQDQPKKASDAWFPQPLQLPVCAG